MRTRVTICALLAVAALGAGAEGASAGTVAVTGPAIVTEGSGGVGGTATYTVTETRGSSETLPAGSWTLSLAPGSATPGADFGPPSMTGAPLSTGACIASTDCKSIFTVTVPIVGDDLYEGDETFTANVAAPAGVTTSGATTTIRDDDPAPVLEVDGDRVLEGNAGVTQARVSFELQAPAIVPVTIHWTTDDGTAFAGQDYGARSGTETIAAGQREAHASIPVFGDTTVEPDERFRVRVTGLTNARLEDDEAGGVTIVNDDVPPPPPPPPAPTHGVTAPSHPGTPQRPGGVVVTTVGTAPSGTGPAGADRTGPAVRLGYSGLSSKGALKLRVACSAAEPDVCSVRLRARTRHLTLGSAMLAHMRPGEVRTVRIALSRAARRALRRAGAFTVSLRARDAAGNVATAQASFAQ